MYVPCTMQFYNRVVFSDMINYLGKPERAPHKWYIESNLLHSDYGWTVLEYCIIFNNVIYLYKSTVDCYIDSPYLIRLQPHVRVLNSSLFGILQLA